MIRILFCNISYLLYYNTRLDRVAPKNGGAYVAKMHDAYEKHNFEECADGQYRGFVETKYRIGYEEGIATNTYNSLHIERIDPFAKGKTYLDDVLVVFCAKPENGQTVIVGWYKNATVFRRRPFYNGRFFNIQADRKDGFLLPEDQRTFVVPRARQDGIGFGQANIWYAGTPECSEYVNKGIRYIESHA